MAKRKKLLEDFKQIIDSGDFEAFRGVFDKCEITATNRGKTTSNAFSYRNLTPKHIQFLVDHGLEVNADCGFGLPAIAFHADNKENLKCLLENGADINYVAVFHRGTALANACATVNAEAVRNLLEAGASIDVPGDVFGKTLLDVTLAHCDNIYIPMAVSIAKMLLDAGAVETDQTKGYVQKIGERFEFFRENISKDIVDDLSRALDELYELFQVPAVPRRIQYDGTTRIAVKETRWQEQYDELWNMLVPGSGKAKTMQGEMIRIVGRVTHEVLDNGGINWDDDFRAMLGALQEFLKKNRSLEEELVEEAVSIAKQVTASTEKKALYRLTEITVNWVLANSEAIPLGEVKYRR